MKHTSLWSNPARSVPLGVKCFSHGTLGSRSDAAGGGHGYAGMLLSANSKHEPNFAGVLKLTTGGTQQVYLERSPAHNEPEPWLEEVGHLGLPEAVLMPVAPHVALVVGDAAVARDELVVHVARRVRRRVGRGGVAHVRARAAAVVVGVECGLCGVS